LRALAPKHGPHAPDAQSTVAQQPVRYHGTCHSRRGFGTQRDVIVPLIDETEHLLLDDVREVPDRALEQLGLLDDRHTHLLVAIGGEDFPRGRLQELPQRRLGGQHVMNAAQRLDMLAHRVLSRAAASRW
jgi:hypothetical protein